MRPTLILGGTSEASTLARLMAEAGIKGIVSMAGRVTAPRAQALPLRVGGFGGAAGLAAYLEAENIGRVIDATHPFAARISGHAAQAAAHAGLPLLRLQRPEWQPGPGDDWHPMADLEAVLAALEGPARRVFLAIGRQNLEAFAARPQHHYLLRLVDPPEAPLPLPDCHAEIARGPFDAAADEELLRRHRIDLVVAKNSGGSGAEAKLAAARALKLPVLMIARPAPVFDPALPVAKPPERAQSPEEALDWLHADLGV